MDSLAGGAIVPVPGKKGTTITPVTNIAIDDETQMERTVWQEADGFG